MPPNAPLPQGQSARARALKLERAGDLTGALDAYQTALRLTPEDPALITAIARLAERMRMPEVAAALWGRVLEREPHLLEAVDGRARALAELGRFQDAIELVRATLLVRPEDARFWNLLGLVLSQDGQSELALTFFDEAIRLDDRFTVAFYNRGNARFDLGRLDEAGVDFRQARALTRRPSEAATIDFASATLMLAQGDLAGGWDAYEVRLSPNWSKHVIFRAPGRRWTPTTPIRGKRVLVVAEQGLGDEIMFANTVPDLLQELGPEGRLDLSVEPRLVQLFQRSFPTAQVTAHATEGRAGAPVRTAPGVAQPGSVDVWAPLGSLTRRFRRSLAEFPADAGYFRPDPARVAHWRQWLGEGSPTVGVTWRSGDVLGERRRHYPPLQAWAPVLRTQGVRFVSIQYGDVSDELPALAELAGAPVLQPPGIVIREDIDDLAALCAALDLTVSVANATGALAGACGAPLVMITGPASWPRLGTDRAPWYPSARALAAPRYGEWSSVMEQVAALVAEVGAGNAAQSA
jgi:hypothetical protein